MRKEDTVSFLSYFLTVRARPLLTSFREWAQAHLELTNHVRPYVDHFSYKCREVREYDELRGRFEEYTDGWSGCRFFHQTIISGRRVAVIGLVDPIETPFGPLKYLELSEPKPMSADRGGFDHIEIYAAHQSIEAMAAYLNGCADMRGAFVKKERPHHTTWDACIMASGRRRDQQDFILRLTDGPLVAKIALEMR